MALLRPSSGPRSARGRTRPALAGLPIVGLGLLCSLLAGCGNLAPSRLVSNAGLTELVAVNGFPIYWVGGSFKGHPLTEVTEDAGGAYSLQYGDCSAGGQAMCVAPLVIATTPRSSFNGDPENSSGSVHVRGVTGRVLEGGRTIQFATGKVVVEIYAQTAMLASAAAQKMTPINRLGTPSSRLPAAAPGGEGPAEPLPGQLPRSLSVNHGRLHQKAAQTPAS